MSDKYTPSASDYITLQGKKYLPARRRVQWFRGDHPDWTINTSVVELNWADGFAIIRAEILDDTGRLIASGMKSETRKGFADFVEKAETGAIARAVAIAGYGTEDALDLDEGAHVADSPVTQPERGEQVPAAGRRAGAFPAAPSPAQYRRGELAELLREKDMHIARLERFADEVGIPKGQRATNEQMDDLIDAVRGHGITQPEPVRAHAGSGVGPAPVGRGGDGSLDLPAAHSDAAAEGDLVDPGVPAATVSAELGTQPAPAPSIEDILAVTGGEEVPPKPGTPQYVALPAPAKASARAYWQRQAEPTLAEQLTVPA